MSRSSLLAKGFARAHRVMPRAAAYVHTNIFINTRGLGLFPDDVCPLGARRVPLTGVPRVAAAYVWGSEEPTMLALHGWGTDSTTMLNVVNVARAGGQSVVCFDAPGHGTSPGSMATVTEYAHATREVLQRFAGIHTVVAHSLASIVAASAINEAKAQKVRNVLLLAPACSLGGVLDRWCIQRGLAPALAAGIRRELDRRHGVPVSHWDITCLGLPGSIDVRILHDPADDSVPISDSHQIAAEVSAELVEAAGTGHHGILASDEMRTALTACLQPGANRRRQSS